MVTKTIAPLRVLSLVPGRARVHLPAWSGNDPRELEAHLRLLDGLREAQANPLTRSVLVRFDPCNLSTDRVLSELSALQAVWCAARGEPASVPEPSKGSVASSTSQAANGKAVVARAVVKGTLGHVALDALFYTGTATAAALGGPIVAPLAAVHLVLDVFVWGAALHPVARHFGWTRRPSKPSAVQKGKP